MPRYTGHALEQMAKRGVSKNEVEAVLADPEIRYPSDHPGRTVLVRSLGDRRIAVIVPDADNQVVITAFNQLDNL